MLFFSLTLSAESLSFAMDKGGCLTCHQYPGLVAYEKPGTLKVLHINEEKYLSSSHGALDCRECHSEIMKIPHKGNTKVSCSTECHHAEEIMEEYKTEAECTVCHSCNRAGIRQMKEYISTFHDSEQSYVLNLKDESSCGICHRLYPHSKSRLARALLNMHSGFITCEVCHLINSAETRNEVCGNCHTGSGKPVYDWTEPANVLFSGQPYGTYYRNPGNRMSMSEKIKNFLLMIIRLVTDPFYAGDSSLKNERTEYSLSRIALFSEENGRKIPLLNAAEIERARRFRAVEKMLSPEARKVRARFFHRDVVKKEISTVCGDCHSRSSVLDYESLGFDEAKSVRLKELNIKGLVTKYKTFYFPKFLDGE